MKKRRLLAWLMTLVMMVGLMPATALADDGAATDPVTSVSTAADSPIQITKSVSSNGDGTYKINMDAYVTGKVEQTAPTPMDIVLVLDVSGSMNQDPSGNEIDSEYQKVSENNETVYNNFKNGAKYYYSRSGYGSVYEVTNVTKQVRDTTTTYTYTYKGYGGSTQTYTEYGQNQEPERIYVKNISKMQALITAVQGFIDATAEKNGAITDQEKLNRISIVKFACTEADNVGNDRINQDHDSLHEDSDNCNYSQIVQELTPVNETNAETMKTTVGNLEAAGATSADRGMSRAIAALNGSTDGRQKVVIMFTDGEPTRWQDFNNDVANGAISKAKTLKDNGALVYTIGMFEDANPENTSTGDNNKFNAYLHAVSSNYPNATAWNSLGTGGSNAGYYKKADSAADVNNIFADIADEIVPAIEAGSNSVLTDTVAENFDLSGISTEGGTVTGVTVQKVPATGSGAEVAWGTPTASTATVTVTGDKVDVTGFDYAANYVHKDADTEEWVGAKLVFSFNIAPDPDATWAVGENKVPTNDTAGMTYGEGNKESITLSQSPEVVITAYGVTYNENGGAAGTAPTDSKGYLNGTQATVAAAPPNMTKEGYTFAGWNTAADGNGKAYAVDAEIDMTANVTLYAQWTVNQYPVTYEYKDGVKPAGAADLPSEEKYDYNATVSVANKPADVAGWTFTGWETTDVENITDGSFAMPANAVKLVGTWTPKEYTVTYQYADGDKPSPLPALPDSATVKCGSDVTVADKPSATGWTFSGWTTSDVTGQTKTYNADEKFAMPANNVVLEGSWSKNEYTVTVNSYYDSTAGEKFKTETITKKTGEEWSVTPPQTVIREVDGENVQYAFDPNESTEKLTGNVAATVNLVYSLDANKDDVPDKYQVTIKYEAETGGNITTDASEVITLPQNADGTYQTSASVEATGATAEVRTGYSFVNWTASANTGLSALTDGLALAAKRFTAVGGNTYTFTANFVENVSTYSADKARLTGIKDGVTVTWKNGEAPTYNTETTPVIPNGESVTLLYAVELNNDKVSGDGTIWNYTVTEDTEAVYVGCSGVAPTTANDNVVEGTLAADETVTLYFTKTFAWNEVDTDETGETVKTTVTNTVDVTGIDEDPKDTTEVIVLTNELAISKSKVNEADAKKLAGISTVTVPSDVDFANDEGKIVADKGDTVTLLYKVTVINPTLSKAKSAVGLPYTVTDDAKYIGYVKEDGVAEPVGKNETNSDGKVTSSVTGTLKYGKSIDLYFTREFEIAGNTEELTNVATLDGTNKTDADTTPVVVNTYNYALTYDANGGTFSDGNTTNVVPETGTTDLNVTLGSTKVPTREGYTFLGWADGKNLEEAQYNANHEFELTSTNPAKTVYAVWEPAYVHTITYVENGADQDIENWTSGKVTTSSADATVDNTVLTRDNYEFVCWVDEDGNKYAPGNSITVSGDVVLTAQWIGEGELSIVKERVEEWEDVPEKLEGVNATDLTIGDNDEPIKLDLFGNEATLLYKVTVTNTNADVTSPAATFALVPGGSAYKVVDKGATWVAGDPVEGELEPGKSAVMYFAKTFDFYDLEMNANDQYQVENTAVVYKVVDGKETEAGESTVYTDVVADGGMPAADTVVRYYFQENEYVKEGTFSGDEVPSLTQNIWVDPGFKFLADDLFSSLLIPAGEAKEAYNADEISNWVGADYGAQNLPIPMDVEDIVSNHDLVEGTVDDYKLVLRENNAVKWVDTEATGNIDADQSWHVHYVLKPKELTPPKIEDGKEVDGSRKEALTESEIQSILNDPEYDFGFFGPGVMAVPASGRIEMSAEDLIDLTEMKLAYRIVIEGDAGTAFTVEDDGVTWVAENDWVGEGLTVNTDKESDHYNTVSGRLNDKGEAVLYCIKTFDAEEISDQKLENTAVIVNESDPKQPPFEVEEKVTIKTEGVAVTKELISEGPFKDGDEVEFKITVTNLGNEAVENIVVVENPGAGLRQGHFINVKDGVDEMPTPDAPEDDENQNAGSEGNENQNAGSEGNENQNAGSEGNENQNAGSEGNENQNAGSEGNENQNAGSEGNENQNAGSEGNENQNAGSEGNENQNAGSEGNENQNAGSEGTTGDDTNIVAISDGNPEVAGVEASDKNEPYLDEDGNIVIPKLAANRSITFTYVAEVDVDADSEAEDFYNTVTVEDKDGNELDEATNTDVKVDKELGIKIKKELVGKDRVSRGERIIFKITVKNTGNVTLTNVEVNEDPGKYFEDGYFCDEDGEKKQDGDTYKIGTLRAGKEEVLYYSVKVASDAPRGEGLENEVTVTTDEDKTDSDENNEAYVPKKKPSGGGDKKKPIVAGDVEEILNTEDHFQYVQGYPDGTVGPERNITRAEATVIFFRLLQDHVRAELLTAENEFPDVNLEDWFNLGVSTMEAGGFVSGYEDGYFRPNGKITRAELATIISNFDDLEPATENKFADVEGHWAEKYVNSAAAKGWISGYDDGLFRPNQYITRAETMSMINRVLNRRVDEDGLHADAKQWRDNVKGQWYYYAVLEATNHHDYQRADVKDMENWTAINPNKVWEN